MPTSDKIVDLLTASELVNTWKSDGDKIVFTNGCFDIVHLGHIDYLEKASSLGSKMVLGLNTDASIQRLKSTSRPVIDQVSRSRLMAALEFIDLVVFFDNDTPLELIKTLMPDVLVKGNDYQIKDIVGSKEVLENGGSVETVELVQGYSTSSIIDKIIRTSNEKIK